MNRMDFFGGKSDTLDDLLLGMMRNSNDGRCFSGSRHCNVVQQFQPKTIVLLGVLPEEGVIKNDCCFESYREKRQKIIRAKENIASPNHANDG